MSQKTGRNFRQLTYSLADQGAVSAGNFLVIALGAHLLSLGEQAKLVYIFGIYYGLVILNAAAFFGSALLVRGNPARWVCYEKLLFKGQVLVSIVMAISVSLALAIVGAKFGWHITWAEALLLGGFLISQQLADFYRRGGYVFERLGKSAITGQYGFWIRLAGLLLIQPDSLSSFLWILIASTLFGMSASCVQAWRYRRVNCEESLEKEMIQSHFHLSKWNVVNAPLAWGGLHLPLLIIGAFLGKEAAAIIGSIRGITTFINVLLELLETYVPTWLASRIRSDGRLPKTPSFRLLAIGLLIWITGFLALWTVGESVLLWMLGERYVPYSHILLIIWMANGLYFIGRVIGLHFRMSRDTLAQVIGSIGGVIALLSFLPVMPEQGIIGGAWSFAIVQAGTILALLGYWVFRLRG